VREFKANQTKKLFEKNLNKFHTNYSKYLYLSWWEKLGLHKPISELKE
jgi:hypothetical protein